MMLAGPALRTVPVTIHIPLAEVPAALTTELIVETARIVAARSCARASASPGRGWRSPASIRMPAKAARSAARTQTIIAPGGGSACGPRASTRVGPLPADTMFHAQRARRATTSRSACITTRR